MDYAVFTVCPVCAPCVLRVCFECASSVLRACSVWAPLAQASERSLNHREALANVTRFAITVFVPLGAMAVAWEMNKHNLEPTFGANGEHQPGLRVRLASQFPNLVDASQLGGKALGRKSHFGRRRTTTFSDGLVAFNRLGGRQFHSLFKKARMRARKTKRKNGL